MPPYKKLIDLLLDKRIITNDDCIVPGHSKAKVKISFPGVLFGFQKVEYTLFLIQFSPSGITLFKLDEKYNICESRTIPWQAVTKFKVRHGVLERSITLSIGTEKLCLKLYNRILGSPWVRKNIKYLEQFNYFYN